MGGKVPASVLRLLPFRSVLALLPRPTGQDDADPCGWGPSLFPVSLTDSLLCIGGRKSAPGSGSHMNCSAASVPRACVRGN